MNNVKGVLSASHEPKALEIKILFLWLYRQADFSFVVGFPLQSRVNIGLAGGVGKLCSLRPLLHFMRTFSDEY